MITLAMKAIGKDPTSRSGITWNDWVSPTGVNVSPSSRPIAAR